MTQPEAKLSDILKRHRVGIVSVVRALQRQRQRMSDDEIRALRQVIASTESELQKAKDALQ